MAEMVRREMLENASNHRESSFDFKSSLINQSKLKIFQFRIQCKSLKIFFQFIVAEKLDYP